MLSLDATQLAIVAAANKDEVSWLFQVDKNGNGVVDYYWSTKAKTWDGHTYTFKVAEFDGIDITRGQSESGIQAPSEFSFTITNKDNTLTTADFSSARVKLLLVIKAGANEAEIRSWSFRIMHVAPEYQTLTFYCKDFLQAYLEGEYPKTGLIASLFIDNTPETPADMWSQEVIRSCVPKIWGRPCIPVVPIYIPSPVYFGYVLGPSTGTPSDYDVYNISTPTRYDGEKQTFSKDDYTFNYADKAGEDGNDYTCGEFVCLDHDGNGVPDSNFGIFTDGMHTPINAEYEVAGTKNITAPGDIIEALLEDWGVPSAMIDATTQASANSIYSGWGLTWNVGLFQMESRKKLLARLLVMCHTELIVRDKIYFKVHSKTSQKTITKAEVIKEHDRGKGTFVYEHIQNRNEKDSGYITYQEQGGSLDNLVKAWVTVKGTYDDPSDEIVSADYVQDSQNAQRIGTLALQRKFLPMATIQETIKDTCLALEPDDVITMNHADYGGTYNILIDAMTIRRDGSIKIKATRFSQSLDDWPDLAPGAITVVTDANPTHLQPVMVGPDAQDGAGTQIGNILPGRLRIGETGNYILFDPVEPIQTFVEGGVTRMKIGDLATDDWGIEFLDHAGNSIFKLDGSGVNTLSGWIADVNKLTCQSGQVGMNAEETGGVDWRFWAGHATPGSAPFRVDENGNLHCTLIYATGGTIGGWTIGATTLSSANITLDGANNRIRSSNYVSGMAGAGFTLEPDLLEVGNIAARGIIRTAVFQKDVVSALGGNFIFSKGADVLDADIAASSNIVTNGTFDSDTGWNKGTGWSIAGGVASCDGSQVGATNLAQNVGFTIGKKYRISFTVSNYVAGNIKPYCGGSAPGTNRSANGTFHEILTATGSSMLYMQGDADFQADIDNVTVHLITIDITIEGNETLAVDDRLWMKDGMDEEWFQVTDASGAPTYVVERDKGDSYEGTAMPAWKKGATVVNTGQSGDGFVYMTASETNAPYISVITHAGAPWTTLTTHMRLGNLNGFLGYTSDLYGAAIGNTNAYLKYEPTNGLRIKGLVEIIGNPAIQNMLMNGGYEETDGTNAYYWTSGSGISTETSGGDNSNKYLKITRSGTDLYAWYLNPDGTHHYFEVNEGEVYEIGGSVKSDGICREMINIRISDKDKANYAWFSITGDMNTAWNKKTGTYTIPAGKKFIEFYVYANDYDGWVAFDNIYLKRIDEKAWSFTHASDRTKIDGGTIYTNTIVAAAINGAGFGTLTITSGKIAINTTDALEIQAGGNINVLAGGDIVLAPSDSNPALIKWSTTYNLGAASTASRGLAVWPTSADTGYFRVGFDPVNNTEKRFNNITLDADTKIDLHSYDDANNQSYIWLQASSIVANQIGFQLVDGGTTYVIYFDPAVVYSGGNKDIDLGKDTHAFDDAYADDWHNVADLYYLDKYNDLKTILDIKPSGVKDKRTGLPLIDDNSLPKWMLTKDKKSKKTLYDPDGKPWVSNTVMFSLLMGAIKELNQKVEKLS